MACDSFYTIGPSTQSLNTSSMPPQGVGVNCLEAIVDIYNALVEGGSYSCADMAGIMDSSIPIGLVPEGMTVSPPVLADFDIPNGPVGDWVLNVTNGNSNLGQIIVSSDGVNKTLTNNSSWTGPIAMTRTSPGYAIGLARDPSTTLSLGTLTFKFNSVVSFNTPQDYVNCAFSACGLPAALPQMRGSVKCANFTRIFNPLNLPLRSK